MGRGRCRFFSNSALAEREGFRPCLRCRPELAPGHAPVDAVWRTARAAARRIEAGALNNGGSLDRLADDLGLSTRQLRRAVQQEFGVSPVELAQTQRLLLAKQLLTESNLPIIQVAFASGFESVRRFNALFRSHYRLTPTRMRRASTTSHAGDCVRLTLAYRPPLAWNVLMRFLAGRATAGVESVEDQAYCRTAAVGDHQGWLKVRPIAGRNTLSVELATSLMPALPEVLARLKNLFDLSARPDVIAVAPSDDSRLARCRRSLPGIASAGRIRRVRAGGARHPGPARLGAGGDDSCRPAGGPLRRADRDAGPGPEPAEPHAGTTGGCRGSGADRAWGSPRPRREHPGHRSGRRSREIDLEPGPDPEAVTRKLQELPGIGDWTAQYIAMRALRWPDAFPAGDLGLLKAWGETSVQRLRDASEAWRPGVPTRPCISGKANTYPFGEPR